MNERIVEAAAMKQITPQIATTFPGLRIISLAVSLGDLSWHRRIYSASVFLSCYQKPSVWKASFIAAGAQVSMKNALKKKSR
mmetsp:Transcript_22294/g.30675  ORF Transcript_22294/g.30675 Transcript_22294/m.30675 type:complete len:82 (-) Transcript_22294:145-390(-)